MFGSKFLNRVGKSSGVRAMRSGIQNYRAGAHGRRLDLFEAEELSAARVRSTFYNAMDYNRPGRPSVRDVGIDEYMNFSDRRRKIYSAMRGNPGNSVRGIIDEVQRRSIR